MSAKNFCDDIELLKKDLDKLSESIEKVIAAANNPELLELGEGLQASIQKTIKEHLAACDNGMHFAKKKEIQ